MRRFVVGWLVVSVATVARAEDDPRDVFGLGKKDDPRDVFGLGKKPKPQDEPLDCSDGTEFGCVDASDPLAETESIYALSTWLSARYLLSLPVANATHDAVAHYALGANRDEAGPSFAGATGLENRWLVEGAPGDGLRTGIADTQIPLTFLDGMWVTAGGFRARDRASTGGIIDAQLKRGTESHAVAAHAWLGWAAPARQRAITRNSYFVRRGELDAGPDAALSLVATGPLGSLLGGTAWYAAGVAPEVSSTKFTWTAATVTDVEGDGLIDGFPGFVATEFVERQTRTPITWRVPLMLRGGLDRGAHHLDVTLLGTAATDARYLFNSTLQAAGVDGTTFVGDAIATWRGKWTNTHVRAQGAWHRTMRRESARDPAAEHLPQRLNAYVPAMIDEDPVIAAACLDEPPGDKYPMVPNCPVPVSWFVTGGAGPLTDTTGDRPTLTADLAHRIGNNVVRVGATGEDTRLVHETHFTGGMQIRSLFPGHESQRSFADPDETCSSDVMLPCPTIDTAVLRYRTRYTAAYVEDTWHAAPNLAVNGGLRWELMWVGPVLHFSNQLSPRLGLSWDPLGKGQSRVWTSMGRSYAYLTAGLGPTILSREKTVDRIISTFGEGRSVDTGAVYGVAPGVEPITQDEVTAGAEVALMRAVHASMWLQGRWLKRGLDTTTSGFDNPGRHGGTPAIRETGLFAVEVATAPTAKLVLRVGYMYGRTIGSWTGAFDPRQGAVLYAGTDFDTTSANLLGRLPTDLGHRTYIEAQRSAKVGSAKLSVATRLTAGSGRPRSAIGETLEGYTIYLIPRGTAARAPVTTQANIRIGAQWRGLDITLDLFNVFNRREAQTTDERYAGGTIRPIDQGSASDLLFIKNEDGTTAPRNPSYGTATSFQAPFSAVLGVSSAF
ncbi:MAG TPA: TonB-dependent receptor [Kofleriaceae bacterium]